MVLRRRERHELSRSACSSTTVHIHISPCGKPWRWLLYPTAMVAAGDAGGPQAPSPLMLSALMLNAFLLGGLLPNSAGAATLATPSRSTTIALTADETRLVVVNREANTVSIIQVKDAQGSDVDQKLAEIAVGLEPRCVAIHPNDEVAYVTNGLTATSRSST